MARTNSNSLIWRALRAGLRGQALEDFVWRGQQKQRGRAGVVGRQRRRMTRSNARYAVRPAGWGEWLAAQLHRRLPRHKSVPIPVGLRPGVPCVDAMLGYPEQREAILAEARKLLPAHQFKTVYSRWLEGAGAAERKAQREADRRAFRAEMRAAGARQAERAS